MPSTACKETTKFNWNLFKFFCALFDTIPCSLWACNHLLSNPRLFSSYPLKIFSTVCSQQYCFSHFLPVRMYFLSLYHFTVFFFFPFSFWTLLPCCLSYVVCPFPFVLGTRQAYVSLSLFLQLLTNCFHFLTFILSSSLHCLSLLFHQPDIVVQTDTIALDSTKHVLSSYKCQIQQIQQRQPGHVTQIRFLLKV